MRLEPTICSALDVKVACKACPLLAVGGVSGPCPGLAIVVPRAAKYRSAALKKNCLNLRTLFVPDFGRC